MTARFETVDEYIAAQPERARAALAKVRSTIRKALPRAREVISYRIPAYKNGDRTVLYFAGWKSHYALYPFGERVVAAFRKDLAKFKVAGSTIRFPMSEPVPTALIARLAKFRAGDIATPRQAKRAAKKKPAGRRAKKKTG